MILIIKHGLQFCAIAFLSLGLSWAGPSTSTQTEKQLELLDKKISQLKQKLAQVQNKRGLLYQELSKTERDINKGINQLRHIQADTASKQQKVVELQRQVAHLNQQLATQQQLLAEQVRTYYKMGPYSPLKWLLNQNEPHHFGHLLTFYQYLVQSRQTAITNIDLLKKEFDVCQVKLRAELDEQFKLQDKLQIQQNTLQRSKTYNTAVLSALNNEIQSKQQILSEYEHNKAKLIDLLNGLAAQNEEQSKLDFAQMRHKLSSPLPIKRQNFQKMNHGVTFFAAEGTPIAAVYHGKVVFSDWLNGYGLLLILDHGNGYMTLYAHNQALFKQAGTRVSAGDSIAAVGHSGGMKKNGLYFEVRHRGKAIPPFDWLS